MTDKPINLLTLYGDDPRQVQLPNDEARLLGELLAEQRQAFVEKFGREPGPDDPILFDPNADEPQPIPMDELLAGFKAAVDAGLEVPTTEEEWDTLADDRRAVLEEHGLVHRIGRNDPCPCGSGQKFKRCHGR